MSENHMTADSPVERLYNGLLKENPTFVLMLGMCPTLAVTTSAINGLGMGLTTAVVLMMSNLIISLLRNIIPNRVRIPAFIVIIASFVTVVQLLLEAYLPFLNKALGMYIPLIVVNCIILGRAESYAYSHGPIASLFDGLGMGLGFSFALTCIGMVRELLGAGKVFGIAILPQSFTPISIFVLAPGAFFVLAALTATQNYLKLRAKKKGTVQTLPADCTQDCASCGVSGCGSHGKFYDTSAPILDLNENEQEMKEERKSAEKEQFAEKASEETPAEEQNDSAKKADAAETDKKASAEEASEETAAIEQTADSKEESATEEKTEEKAEEKSERNKPQQPGKNSGKKSGKKGKKKNGKKPQGQGGK